MIKMGAQYVKSKWMGIILLGVFTGLLIGLSVSESAKASTTDGYVFKTTGVKKYSFPRALNSNSRYLGKAKSRHTIYFYVKQVKARGTVYFGLRRATNQTLYRQLGSVPGRPIPYSATKRKAKLFYVPQSTVRRIHTQGKVQRVTRSPYYLVNTKHNFWTFAPGTQVANREIHFADNYNHQTLYVTGRVKTRQHGIYYRVETARGKHLSWIYAKALHVGKYQTQVHFFNARTKLDKAEWIGWNQGITNVAIRVATYSQSGVVKQILVQNDNNTAVLFTVISGKVWFQKVSTAHLTDAMKPLSAKLSYGNLSKVKLNARSQRLNFDLSYISKDELGGWSTTIGVKLSQTNENPIVMPDRTFSWEA